MSQIFWCEVSRLRRSIYNPRIVQDPEKTRILKASIAREGVKQPLIVYDAGDGFFEVLDGGRRLAAAAELGVERLPCVVIPAVDIPKQSLTIHFSQDDLTPEEVVVLVERLVGEEVFKSVEDVCRYLGVSKSWYYTLKKAVKRPENVEGLPVTTLELIERTGLEESKKQELAELLKSTRLPRDVVREVVKEVEENPGEAAAIVGKHHSLDAETARRQRRRGIREIHIHHPPRGKRSRVHSPKPGPDTLDGQDTAPRPPHRKTSLATGVKHTQRCENAAYVRFPSVVAPARWFSRLSLDAGAVLGFL
jgi:hypothetical protein